MRAVILSNMRALAIAVVVGAAACVPAAAEKEPRGAVALRTEPSAPSRGEPFTTSDGWTVTVDAFALHVSIAAKIESSSEYGVVGGGNVLFQGGRSEDLVVLGIPAGSAFAVVTFSSSSVYDDGIAIQPDDIRAVPPEMVQRFLLPPSGPAPTIPGFISGPSVIVVAHARKGERTLLLDVALRSAIPQHGARAVIAANALTPVSTPIAVEALFTTASGTVAFDDFASADKDLDGVLSAEELGENSNRGCLDCNERSLLEMLEARTDNIIGLPVWQRGF